MLSIFSYNSQQEGKDVKLFLESDGFTLAHFVFFFFFIGDEMAASSSGKFSQYCSLTLNFLYLENSISFF